MLLAYAKLSLYDELLGSTVPDDPYLGARAAALFPAADRRALPRRARASPAAPRDHRHPARQFDDQPRRRRPWWCASPTRPAPRRPRIAAAFAAVRDSYDMIALNTAIDTLDNKVPGKLQLELYAAVQDLLLDRLVWFLRNVDLSQGLAVDRRALPRRHRGGRGRARRRAAGGRGGRARGARRRSSATAGVPDGARAPHRRPAGAGRRARHRAGRRPHRPEPGRGRRHLFRGRSVLPPRPHRPGGARHRQSPTISTGSRSTARSIRSATPSAGSPPRWRATASPAPRRSRPGCGAPARGRAHPLAVHEIANSGLTLSKLSVAASLLGDLAKQ